MSKEKNTPKNSFFKKSANKIIDFSKLLWSVITYKFVLLIIAVIIVVNLFAIFRSIVKRKIDENTEQSIESMATEGLEKIRIRINDEFSVLSTLSLLYDGNEEINLETTKEMFEIAINSHQFVGIDLLTASNERVLSLGSNVKYEDEIFIESILTGENTVSSIFFDENKNEYICLGVPIYKNGTIIGALIGEYEIKEFTNILDTSSFGQVGSIFISEEDGRLVARPESVGENTNLFDLLDSININNEKKIEQLKKNLVKGRSGIITYGNSKYKRYICYNVIPDTNWYAISIVSGNLMDETAHKVSESAVHFAIEVSFVFAIYILITIGMDIRLLKKEEELEEKNSAPVEETQNNK